MIDYPVIDPVATGERINTFRKNRGFSVASLREYFGLSTTNAIYKWLKGETLPTVDNFLALSVLLEVPMNDLIVYHYKGMPR